MWIDAASSLRSLLGIATTRQVMGVFLQPGDLPTFSQISSLELRFGSDFL
jgi:hypothetical protein